MKKLLSIILSITMLLSMATVAFADDTFVSSGAREVEGIIRVGVNAEFPPFEYMENDKIIGFDIDLMNYIAARIGYGVEFVNMSFDKLIPAVVNSEVDCAISAISITDERKEVVDFSEIYLDTYEQIDETSSQTTNYAIVFHGDSSEKENVLNAAGYECDPLLYTLVNDAIKELKNDGTIEKLLEKYDIPKANYAHGPGYPVDVTVNSTDSDVNELSDGTPLAPPSDWAVSDVKKAEALNITEKEKLYRYRMPITREEFCGLIYNYCYNVIEEVDTVTGENKFTDTTNSKIIRLNAMGIINGKTETEFAPNDLLTREEAAVILNRMVNKTIPVPVTEMHFNFDDEKSISSWASDSIQVMCNMGVLNGVGENKFAPKETYTTEQAIATIVRVYAAQSANSSVIGGADAPTEIVVTDTIDVNDFYVDEAIKLITESGKLAADKDFISLYTTNDEMTDKILALSKVDFNKPKEIYYLSADREQIIANIEALAKAEGVDMNEMGDIWVEHILKRFNFSTLASLINSSYGAENLAALTILTNSRGYIMPKDFKNNFALFVQHEGDYSAIVSFSEFGDGVISANISFVKNGDKDNVFGRLHEITSAVGEDALTIAKVK